MSLKAACARNVKYLMSISFFAMAIACAPTLPEINGDKYLLDFLNTGLTREAILMELGTPSASFEGDRIFTYRIAGNEETGYLVSDRQVVYGNWGLATHSLVLVFDENGELEKYKLVKVQ